MELKVNIAIDGPSGVGKSTVSKLIAKKLNYTFINSGSIYRTIAYHVIKNDIDINNEKDVISSLDSLEFSLSKNEELFYKGENITLILRSEQISISTPVVSKIPEVREFVTSYIQKMTKGKKGFIIDGRDTTFKVMPHADVKIFLWATAEERAQRRVDQNHQLGYNSNYDEVLYEIKKRDHQDMNREHDPLHKTEDSILIDCTNMKIDEVVNKIISLIK
ncbi:(d)CMP kinase [Mycoplasmopsis synoviae]|uniref:Cytidylate kinase n=3 Tax=Mycoplasmopsis synoviae TaxID=2109 RepID=KCY_MYCS5|nr:(d)CMP kinase [Mycoplasmopsis synoviae]Q4A6Q8.2 RecName: Full=Cytidylate kinase; Short=CK; AltName: Full=Cytidine monophosphate kinase; Short=CMP kinase [Mycoplasmopsis synoviae 53]AAZ43563.2 cytidylate kinase [Mycoplasmopsis synoviae 53]AKJ21073.1 Cytidylate kinase [Mycoplasmopsis synoviae]AQU48410.1 Cytidylate kinase [Mycoplasmopsis synoviae]QXV99608.1 (d)CMP kinase [Mycoplasmopsis synoviae]ULL02568.1 (d)CMP kinase [Mycoplasmopsis synoviae]